MRKAVPERDEAEGDENEGAGEAAFHRVVMVVRPGASVSVIESHLGGAGLSGARLDFGIQEYNALIFL